MTEQAYPVPSPIPSPLPTKDTFTFEDWKRPDGWIEAPWKKAAPGIRKVLGIDCEMVSLATVSREGHDILTASPSYSA
jgi:RNA exonuclease 1